MARIYKFAEAVRRSVETVLPEDIAEFAEPGNDISDTVADPDSATVNELPDSVREAIEAAEKNAYEEGFRRGYQEGWQAAQNDFREEARAATGVLHVLEQRLAEAHAEFLEKVEPVCAQLAIQIAEKLVHHVVQHDPQSLRSIVSAALQHVHDALSVTVQLNPDDYALLQANGVNLPETWGRGIRVEYVLNPSVNRGGCCVETPNQWIDAQLDTGIKRIVDNLMGTAHP